MLVLATYAKMTPDQRKAALEEELTRPSDSAAARVAAEIRELELRYDMTSATMRLRTARGEIDTADTARWLVLLDALGA
jgi:hypothetical protein